MDLSLLPQMPQQFHTGTFQSSMVPTVKGAIVLVFAQDNKVTARFVYTGQYMNGITREISLVKQGDVLTGFANGQSVMLSNIRTENGFLTGNYTTQNPGDFGTFRAE